MKLLAREWLKEVGCSLSRDVEKPEEMKVWEEVKQGYYSKVSMRWMSRPSGSKTK